MDELTTAPGIAALAAGALALAALIVGLLCLRRLRQMRAAQKAVLGEHGARDLVAHTAQLDESFAALHAYVEDVAAKLHERLGVAEERLDGAIAHCGLVRYDAYNEMSGRQSTSIA